MAYGKENMLYDDYKWSAKADHDNPKIIGGNDRSQLNRTEGYEMLYFIKSLAKSWGWGGKNINSFKSLERIIRTVVPSNIRTHAGIKEWIEERYTQI